MDGYDNHRMRPTELTQQNVAATPAALSTRGAMLTIIKCAIGAGSFSLPRAFMDGGVYISFLTTIFLGLLSAYTLLLLVDSSTISSLLTQCSTDSKKDQSSIELAVMNVETSPNFLSFNYKPIDERSRIELMVGRDVPTKVHCSTYPEMGAVAFPELNFKFRGSRYNFASMIITIGILMTSLGVCSAYVDFIAGTLPEVVRGWSQNRHIFLTIDTTPWVVMPIILGFSFLRTMRVLTYTSFFGNLLVLIGCFVVLVLGIIRYHSTITVNHNFVEWQTLPRYVGGNTFLFAIHVVILPLMQQMENQNGNKNKRDAISGSYMFITSFNAIFGSIGFLLFAKSTCTNDQATPYAGPCDNILSSISGGSILDFVKILVSIDLLFTIPLILAASRAVIEDGILNSALVRVGRRKWLDRYRRKCGRANASDEYELNATGFNHQLTEGEGREGGESVRQQNVNAVALGTSADVDSHVETGNGTRAENTPHTSHDYHNRSAVDQSVEERKCDEETEDGGEFSVIDFNTETDNPIHNRFQKKKTSATYYDSDQLNLGIKMAQEMLIRNERFTTFVQYSVRTTLVMAVILMAVLIPNFGDMVDLVGGVVCSFTGFFLPPIIYMRLRSKLFQHQLPIDNSVTISALTHNLKKKIKIDKSETAAPNETGVTADVIEVASGEGATYVEKQPMSVTFLILHFLITFFGLVTMVTTVIVTIVNINGRDAAEASA